MRGAAAARGGANAGDGDGAPRRRHRDGRAQTAVLEFFRFHAIHLNTGPNTGALFMGKAQPADAMDTGTDPVSPHAGAEPAHRPASGAAALDRERETEAPFLWSPFNRNGYATLMIQGLCQDWTQTYAKTPAVSNPARMGLAWRRRMAGAAAG